MTITNGIQLLDQNGNPISTGQATMANSVPVVIASDQTQVKAVQQIAGANAASNNGATNAQTMRVTLSNDSTGIINQSNNNAPVAVGAGNTVIKAAAGQLCVIVVTTAGTTGFTVFDNATTNSGTILYQSKAAPAVGDIYAIFGHALNGITVANTATGPAITVFFN